MPSLVPDVVGEALEYYPQLFASGAFDTVQRADGEGWIAAGPTGTRWVTANATVDFGSDAGELLGAAAVDGVVVVAGTQGLFVVQQGELQASPLGEDQRLGAVSQLLSVADALWLSTSTGLFVFEDDRLWRVDIDGRSSGVRLVAGGPSGPTVWAAEGDTLYAVTRQDAGGWRATQERAPTVVVDLAADAAGTVWTLSADGRLSSRSSAGGWRAHEAITDVRQLASDAASNRVWFATDNDVYMFDGEAFRPTGVGASSIATADDGFMAADADGLRRFVPDRRADVVGLPSGLLSVVTEIIVRPAEPDDVVEITATIDGSPIPVSAETWTLSIDPASLEDGVRELVVTVRYADAEPTVERRTFTVRAGPAPNWNDDIQPLFIDHCALCHGADGGARVLDSSESWIENIETILFNVRNGRMPLPPNPTLAAEQVAWIEGWQAAGFPLSRE